MNCPHCQAHLTRPGRAGATLFKARGMVLRKNAVALVCPKCKADVPLPPEQMQQLHACAVLFFKGAAGGTS